jgi:hypothetical protein
VAPARPLLFRPANMRGLYRLEIERMQAEVMDYLLRPLVLPPPTAIAIVGEAQEVEGVGPSLLPLGILSFVPSKADHTRLFWMKYQIELREPLADLGEIQVSQNKVIDR